MHVKQIHDAALALIAVGVNDCEISRRLGISRTTVRDWRRPRYVPQPKSPDCPRCWRATRAVCFDASDYAELLGLYLGDGHISILARTQRLRLFLDSRYTKIVDEAEALLGRVFPNSRVGRLLRHDGAMAVLCVYHSHLSCLLPQHGPGKKHHRPIVLERWQEDLVLAAPWAFLRGCIRSDGCVFINRTGKYEYLSYCFDNRSRDILGLFTAVCRFAGLEPRPGTKSVRIYRRASVALLERHVGLKE